MGEVEPLKRRLRSLNEFEPAAWQNARRFPETLSAKVIVLVIAVGFLVGALLALIA